MSVTIKVNGTSNSLVHKGSNGISTATLPDVCKTPTPGGPVPIPYPNISQSSSLAKGTKTVKADGGNMCANKGSEFSMSNGDEPGVTGGVKSSTFIKESTWILYSFDVKLEGKNACRLSDKKFHNHQNTVNLAGEIQEMLGAAAFEHQCKNCKGEARKQIGRAKIMRTAYANAGGKTAGDVEKSMGANAAYAGAPMSKKGQVGGTTDFDTGPDIKPQKGTCGPLKTASTTVHENSHWADAKALKADPNLTYDAAKDKYYNDGAFRKKTEVKAYEAEIKALDDFINECNAAGK